MILIKFSLLIGIEVGDAQSALGMERTLPLGASLDEAPTTQGENDCLESKFECRTDAIGLNLAAVSTVVRDTQRSSLT